MKQFLGFIISAIPPWLVILFFYLIGGLAIGIAGYVALALTGGGSLLVCVVVGVAVGLAFGVWALLRR